MAVRPTQLGAKFVGFMDPDFQLVVIPRWLYDGVRADAVSTERDACAALCDKQVAIYNIKIQEAFDSGDREQADRSDNFREVAEWLADAIRARGQGGA